MAQELNKSPEAPRLVSDNPPEPYFVVRFHDKSSPNDDDKVVLTVQGETLQITRGKEVTLPLRYLECADHTYYHVYRQEPGEQRKVIGKVLTYPYQKIREGRKEDFRRTKAEGTRQVYEAMERETSEDAMTDLTKDA